MPEDRRHIAVMFTDIVGYTALMGKDEDHAFEVLRKNRELHKRLIKKYQGQLIKEMGDGMLISFQLASDAVRCGYAIQQEAKKQDIPLKIGIHEGEMVFEGADVLGDGVNVASRLQELSDEGCISISGAVYRDIKNKPGIEAEFFKEELLKNVDEPIRVYKVHCEEEVEEVKSVSDQKPGKSRNWVPYYFITGLVIVVAVIFIWQIVPTRETSQPLHKAPVDREISIAVLPFDNLSGDPEQEYMCDGLTEEIIFHLSQIHSLDKVIARTSVMKFKNTDILLPEIAEILDVNNILVGSYRQSVDKLRIAAQLIDPATEDIKWSDSYDRSLDDILDIQGDIARNIAAALELNLTNQEAARIEQKTTHNITAYSLVKRARSLFVTGYPDQALDLFKQAVELDPGYPDAYAGIAAVYLLKGSWKGTLNMREAARKAAPYIKKALELNPESLMALSCQANVYYWYDWNFVAAQKKFREVLSIDPGFTHSLTLYTMLLMHMGLYEEALEWAQKTREMDPLNIYAYSMLSSVLRRLGERNRTLAILEEATVLFPDRNSLNVEYGDYYMAEGEYSKAIEFYEQYNTSSEDTGDLPAPWVLARLGIACYLLGDTEKAIVIKDQIKDLTGKYGVGSPEYMLAVYYSGIGKKEESFEWLEKAYNMHNLELINLKVQPQFRILQEDPRYWDLYKKVGFRAFDEYTETKQMP